MANLSRYCNYFFSRRLLVTSNNKLSLASFLARLVAMYLYSTPQVFSVRLVEFLMSTD